MLDTLNPGSLAEDSVDCAYVSPPDYVADEDYAAYLEQQRLLLADLWRVLRIGRRVIWNTRNVDTRRELVPVPHALTQLARAQGFCLRDEFYWEDPGGVGRFPSGTYSMHKGPAVILRHSFRTILVLQKPSTHIQENYAPLPDELKPYDFLEPGLYRDRITKQVWSIPEKEGGYPLALIADCLRFWSRPGELVYVPFMGKGEAALACLQWRRHFVGVCAGADYEIARHRIEVKKMQLLHEELLP